MDILEGLNAAVSYMEAHLREEVDLELAARLASQSADGFQRLFSGLTGMSAKEFIRRSRLTRAAYDLRRGGSVIGAALRWGYNGPDAFRRAFVKQHGIPPVMARDPACPIKAVPPISFRILCLGGKEMDFRMVETAGIPLRGLNKAFEGPAGARFEQEHIMWADHHDNIPGRVSASIPGTWYGIWDGGTYWIAREPADAPGDELGAVAIPAGTYAAFRTGRGGFAGDELPRLRALIFDSWLRDAGYRQAADREVEVYHLTPESERSQRWYEIWAPVEPL